MQPLPHHRTSISHIISANDQLANVRDHLLCPPTLNLNLVSRCEVFEAKAVESDQQIDAIDNCRWHAEMWRLGERSCECVNSVSSNLSFFEASFLVTVIFIMTVLAQLVYRND
ncbi:hypothetical protein L596_025498 [Steinernema carpocapsae]|uniref:Uncharacterized protein n=1 Tax=Steinernema carpocapsae TaxID=34508 RepID=A0A4U5M803_STECR|nr:hypothetical protein L596_025498 [Steinernema carpocapsae]